MINEFKELLPAIVTVIGLVLPTIWAFRMISKETADRYAAVTRECATISKETADRYAAVTRECKEDYKELNEKIYKLMLERGMK